jgi:UDP-N-acetylmuramoylalanine--D-glutamate ligase
MTQAWVVGLGKSGFAAAQLLKSKGWQVWVSDRRRAEETQELSDRQQYLIHQEVKVSLGFDLLGLDLTVPFELPYPEFFLPQLLVISPGIAWYHPTLVAARKLGIQVVGEVELAWQYLQHLPWLSITGTNGKTTTTAMIAKIFQVAGYNAPACGNIGLPICEVAMQIPLPDWIVAELSSYQIEAAPSVRSQIGVWTTFTPDHLSRHGTLETYSEIKSSLLKRSNLRVLNGNDAYLAEKGEAILGNQLIWTNANEILPQGIDIQAGWVRFKGEPVLDLAGFHLPGEHNLQNLLMAVAATKLAGIESKAIAQAISEFRGVPHRLEYVGTWQQFNFINDSKATNYDAALVGLKSVSGSVILIAGGEEKEGDSTLWLQTIRQEVTTVLLIGKAAPKFAQMLTEIKFSNYLILGDLEKAIAWVFALAPNLALGQTTILFSPACASFDQYANFEQRGDRFRQLFEQYKQQYKKQYPQLSTELSPPCA